MITPPGGLGLVAVIPSPPDNAIHLGSLQLRAYGLAIALGVIAAVTIARRRWAARGGDPADINAIARRMAERRREPGAPEVLEALELVTRFVGTVRAEVLGTTLNPEGGEV